MKQPNEVETPETITPFNPYGDPEGIRTPVLDSGFSSLAENLAFEREIGTRTRVLRPLDLLPSRILARINFDGPIPEHRPDLGPCHVWMGNIRKDGYGRAYLDGRVIPAHHLFFRYVPEGLVRDHLCRNRACVRRSHMEAVTNIENRRRGLHGVLATHCPRGHTFTEETLQRPHPRAGKHCRVCDRIRKNPNAKRPYKPRPNPELRRQREAVA